MKDNSHNKPVYWRDWKMNEFQSKYVRVLQKRVENGYDGIVEFSNKREFDIPKTLFLLKSYPGVYMKDFIKPKSLMDIINNKIPFINQREDNEEEYVFGAKSSDVIDLASLLFFIDDSNSDDINVFRACFEKYAKREFANMLDSELFLEETMETILNDNDTPTASSGAYFCDKDLESYELAFKEIIYTKNDKYNTYLVCCIKGLGRDMVHSWIRGFGISSASGIFDEKSIQSNWINISNLIDKIIYEYIDIVEKAMKFAKDKTEG